jgi:LPS sulfotransferase NodH
MATNKSLGYFGARFDSETTAEPAFSYAILSSQRTGSNYLCARLSNIADRFGFPMEYLHADAIRLMGARLLPDVTGNISLDSYLRAVARVRTSRDGWFGTKVQPDQLLRPFGGNFENAIA